MGVDVQVESLDTISEVDMVRESILIFGTFIALQSNNILFFFAHVCGSFLFFFFKLGIIQQYAGP